MSRGLSPQEKAELWRRWKAGETVAQIARTMGKSNLSLFGVVWPYGGIAPRERCRSRLALTLAEREEISRGLCARRSIRQIAQVLGRAPSSVSRADPTRRWYMGCLQDRDVRLLEFQEIFALGPSAVLHHLRVLDKSGLVLSRKDGPVRLYSLRPEGLREAERWLRVTYQAALYRRPQDGRPRRF